MIEESGRASMRFKRARYNDLLFSSPRQPFLSESIKKGTCFFELVPSPAHDWFLFVALISKWTGRAFDQVPVTSLPVIPFDRK
jgi:hypothetical protein